MREKKCLNLWTFHNTKITQLLLRNPPMQYAKPLQIEVLLNGYQCMKKRNTSTKFLPFGKSLEKEETFSHSKRALGT